MVGYNDDERGIGFWQVGELFRFVIISPVSKSMVFDDCWKFPIILITEKCRSNIWNIIIQDIDTKATYCMKIWWSRMVAFATL